MSWTDWFWLAFLMIGGVPALVPRGWRLGRTLDRPVYPDASASY